MNYSEVIKEYEDKMVNKEQLLDCSIGLDHVATGENIKLYKYYSPEMYNLSAVNNRKTWFSKFDRFNDPYDCSINLERIISNGLSEIENNVYVHEYNKHADNIEKNIEDFKNKVFISCYSESYDSTLMWSHYAKNHSGFCLEYDYFDLDDFTHQNNDEYTKIFAPVIYGNKKLMNTKDVNVREFNLNIIKRLFYKAYQWIYEQEWRMIFICKEKNNQSGILFNSPKPKSIILGCKTDLFVQEIFKDICEKHSVNLDKMYMDKYEFVLHRKSLYDAKNT